MQIGKSASLQCLGVDHTLCELWKFLNFCVVNISHFQFYCLMQPLFRNASHWCTLFFIQWKIRRPSDWSDSSPLKPSCNSARFLKTPILHKKSSEQHQKICIIHKTINNVSTECLNKLMESWNSAMKPLPTQCYKLSIVIAKMAQVRYFHFSSINLSCLEDNNFKNTNTWHILNELWILAEKCYTLLSPAYASR